MLTRSEVFNSAPVGSTFIPDHGPGKNRIGSIVLSNDYVTERDFINARPSDDVTLFSDRVANTSGCTLDTLSLMKPHITQAAASNASEGRLDVIAYACTSGTVVIGYEAICDLIHVARPAIPVVTPITASLAALNRFGADRVAVLTPYSDEVNGAIAAHLENQGKTISAFTSFGITDNEVMAAIPPNTIFQAALEADRPDAQAMFVSCTAIRALDVADRIEHAIGKPVVTANQAMIWQCLRWTGCDLPVAGHGRLFNFVA